VSISADSRNLYAISGSGTSTSNTAVQTWVVNSSTGALSYTSSNGTYEGAAYNIVTSPDSKNIYYCSYTTIQGYADVYKWNRNLTTHGVGIEASLVPGTVSLNDPIVREIAGLNTPGTPIRLGADFYGKSKP
jgi:hypothetical protein